MTTYNNLTAEQKKNLKDFSTVVRPLAGQIGKLMLTFKDAILTYNAIIKPIIDSLDAGEIIPNETGLSGAQPVDKQILVDFINAISQVESGFNTDANRSDWIKLAGINAG